MAVAFRDSAITSPTSTHSIKMPPPPRRRRRSPLLPTSIETVLLAIYPATLFIGSVFSLLDPSARSAFSNARVGGSGIDAKSSSDSPFTVAAAAAAAALEPPSYFAQKSNLFNVGFVKLGWLWTSAAFVVFLFTYSNGGDGGLGPPIRLTPQRLQGLLRYALVTAWWAVVTRWFFGPALIDRIFLVTGGFCDGHPSLITGGACKATGGRWRGGHDVSGHVFMLTLSSIFLWMEVLHLALRSQGLEDQRTISSGLMALNVRSAQTDRRRPSDDDPSFVGNDTLTWGVRIATVVAILSWWMVLMTAVYFHTWIEKVYSYHHDCYDVPFGFNGSFRSLVFSRLFSASTSFTIYLELYRPFETSSVFPAFNLSIITLHYI